MKLAERYNNLKIEHQNLAITVVISLLAFAGLCFLGLVGYIGVAFGFLMGSAIQIACYLSIIYGAGFLTNDASKPSSIGITLLFTFGRMILYAGGLVLGALCTYRWNFPWINVWGVFAGYMPLYIIILIHSLIVKRDQAKEGQQ